MLSRNRCSFNPILNFDNQLMEGAKIFFEFLEDISKEFGFMKLPIYLLKKALLLRKILMVMLKF